MEVPPGHARAAAAHAGENLDEPWQEAFRQAWAARRTQPARIGPRADELGLFATMISRIGTALTPSYERALRAPGEGATADLAHELAGGGEVSLLTAMEPDAASGYLWPRLHQLVNGSRIF